MEKLKSVIKSIARAATKAANGIARFISKLAKIQAQLYVAVAKLLWSIPKWVATSVGELLDSFGRSVREERTGVVGVALTGLMIYGSMYFAGVFLGTYLATEATIVAVAYIAAEAVAYVTGRLLDGEEVSIDMPVVELEPELV